MKTYKIKLDLKGATETPEGYIKVRAKIARIGIQQYLESQVMDGGSGTKIINVMRKEDDVFESDSLDSFSNLTLTNNHPPTGVVDSKNWKKYAVGFGGIAKRDGDFIVVDITITDEKAIKSWKEGRKEISNGYLCEDVFEPGIDNGQNYDYLQKNIRGNHIALVDKGRCGGACRTLDTNNNPNKGDSMKIKVDGISIEIADDTAATVVEKALATRDTRITSLEADVSTANQKVDKATGEKEKLEEEGKEKDKNIKDMEKEKEEKTDSATIDAMIQIRMNNVEVAKRVMGDDYKWDGKSCEDIKNDCVAKVYPDIKMNEANTDFIDGLFAAVVTTKAVAKDNVMANIFTAQKIDGAKNDNGLGDYVSNVLDGKKEDK